LFLRPDQLKSEIMGVIDFVFSTMKDFGFTICTLSFRRNLKNLLVRRKLGQATAALKDALNTKGLKFDVDEGGGAFYGPKIDIN